MSVVALAAAWCAVVILVGLAVLQALVASGKPYGRIVWGGAHAVLPKRLRIGSIISIPLYAIFGLILLDRVGIAPIFGGGAFGTVAAWVLVGYFTLGIVMNAISRSAAERKVMVPTAVILALCSLLVALS